MTETDAMVFVVDDDAPMRESLKNLIRSVGLRAELFASAQEFLRSERPNVPSCLVLDVRLPGLSGLDLQRRSRPFDGRHVVPQGAHFGPLVIADEKETEVVTSQCRLHVQDRGDHRVFTGLAPAPPPAVEQRGRGHVAPVVVVVAAAGDLASHLVGRDRSTDLPFRHRSEPREVLLAGAHVTRGGSIGWHAPLQHQVAAQTAGLIGVDVDAVGVEVSLEGVGTDRDVRAGGRKGTWCIKMCA